MGVGVSLIAGALVTPAAGSDPAALVQPARPTSIAATVAALALRHRAGLLILAMCPSFVITPRKRADEPVSNRAATSWQRCSKRECYPAHRSLSTAGEGRV